MKPFLRWKCSTVGIALDQEGLWVPNDALLLPYFGHCGCRLNGFDGGGVGKCSWMVFWCFKVNKATRMSQTGGSLPVCSGCILGRWPKCIQSLVSLF